MKQEVKSVVNLNVDQGELVEILLNDFREAAEKKLEETEVAVNKLGEELEETSGKLREQVLLQVKDPIYDAVLKIATDNEMGPETKIEIGGTTKELDRSLRVDIVNVEQGYKNPVTVLKRWENEARENKFNNAWKVSSVTVPERAIATITTVHNSLKYVGKQFVIKPTALINKIVEKQENLIREIAQLKNVLYETRKQVLEIDHGDKRFKARFMKASLGRSKEGKEILGILESVKSTMKLIV